MLPVNWCPALGTVLANEEVIDGLSERGSHPVQRMPLRQWMLRITAYADRLGKRSGARRLAGRHQEAAVRLDRPQYWRGSRFLHWRRSEFVDWKSARKSAGFPRKPTDDVLRIYTTSPGYAVRRDLHGHCPRTSAGSND